MLRPRCRPDPRSEDRRPCVGDPRFLVRLCLGFDLVLDQQVVAVFVPLAAWVIIPEYRRRGIGASLVNAIVSEAAAARTDVLYLLTTEREDFYAQLGWEVFDRAGEATVMSRVVAAGVA